MTKDEMDAVNKTFAQENFDTGIKNPDFSPALMAQQWSLWDEDTLRMQSKDCWWGRAR
jgi:hypothetical protein